MGQNNKIMLTLQNIPNIPNNQGLTLVRILNFLRKPKTKVKIENTAQVTAKCCHQAQIITTLETWAGMNITGKFSLPSGLT